MKLSAVIITLNEERNIRRCIESLLKVADEIIVLDSLSTDNTKAICTEYEIQFVERPWEGYSQSKNYLNGLAQHPYLLSIDADEVIDTELEKAILLEKKKGFEGVYNVNRMTNYMGKWIKHSGWYPDVKTRIFPKTSCYWIGELVHEELYFPEAMPKKLLKGHLEHYSYYSFEDHRERADKYSLLTAKKHHLAGKNCGILKPYLSAIGRFIGMYIFKLGFLDGKMGFKIAQISAASNILKYKELRRLNLGI